MNEPTKSWNEGDVAAVEAEMEKLFALQDRPLPKEKKALLVSELGNSGLPAFAIIGGLKKLMVDDEVTKLTFPKILGASKAEVDPAGIYEIIPCDDCDKRGLVTMLDAEKYQYALACRCPNGQQWVDRGHQRWWGEKSQVSSRKHILTGEIITRTLYLREW
jgi:hypothetical protein